MRIEPLESAVDEPFGFFPWDQDIRRYSERHSVKSPFSEQIRERRSSEISVEEIFNAPDVAG